MRFHQGEQKIRSRFERRQIDKILPLQLFLKIAKKLIHLDWIRFRQGQGIVLEIFAKEFTSFVEERVE